VRIYLKGFHRLSVTGKENIPAEAPFVLVSNHQSHLDALVLASQLRRAHRLKTHPIAAADTFFDSPVNSLFSAGTLNALPMQRGRVGAHALEDLRKRLVEEKCIYVLFPEGTRSRDGQIARFKPGVGMFLAGTNVPVLPCHIRGAFEAFPATRKFPKPWKVSLTVGSPMTFADVVQDRDGWTCVAETLEAAVRTLCSSGKPG
jgi:1-acyl-sn-glycerol-3-phosphate acyltransferase